MKIWRVGKAAFKAVKPTLEDPKTRAKIVSTGKKVWQDPAFQARASSLLKRFKKQSGSKPDKNQTKTF